MGVDHRQSACKVLFFFFFLGIAEASHIKGLQQARTDAHAHTCVHISIHAWGELLYHSLPPLPPHPRATHMHTKFGQTRRAGSQWIHKLGQLIETGDQGGAAGRLRDRRAISDQAQ